MPRELLDFMEEWRRLNGNITEEELAGRADISKGTFTGWRKGSRPSPRIIQRLAAAMEVPDTELFALAGYAGEKSGEDGPDQLTANERLWLQMLRELGEAAPGLLSAVLAMLKEYHRQLRGREQSRRVAERPGGYGPDSESG